MFERSDYNCMIFVCSGTNDELVCYGMRLMMSFVLRNQIDDQLCM